MDYDISCKHAKHDRESNHFNFSQKVQVGVRARETTNYTFTEKNVDSVRLTKDSQHIRFELRSIRPFANVLGAIERACRHQTPTTTMQCTFTVRVIWSSHQWLIKIT